MMILLMVIIVVVMMMVMITQIGHRRAACHEDFKGHVDAALWKSFIDNLTIKIHVTILTNPCINLEKSMQQY